MAGVVDKKTGAIRYADPGDVDALFDQGLATILSGEMTPMKKGAAMIATELSLPIVPVYISGTHRAYPKGGKFLKPARLRVHFGEPITPASFDVKNTKLVYTTITQELTKRIEQLRDRHGHD